MINYLCKTWYFFVIRILLFLAEFLLFILLADRIQVFLWNLFNMGMIGMIISGFLGALGAYAFISYIDRFILLLLKLWNISVFVAITEESCDTSNVFDNIKTFFPQIGTVIIANNVLRKSAPKVFESVVTELEENKVFGNIVKFRKNIIVRKLLQNIVDFVDECSIFYVFKHGDSSENSMVTLGRGVLFYIKSFPKLLLGSTKILIFTNILFLSMFIMILMIMLSITYGFIGTIYAFFFSCIIATMLNRILLELIKMGFMLSAFNKCLEAKEVKDLHDIENSEERFTLGDTDNKDNKYIEETNDSFLGSDNIYADLLASVKNRNRETVEADKKPNSTFKIVKPDNKTVGSPEEQNLSEGKEDKENTIYNYFSKISLMDIKDVSKELQNFGITAFNRFF